jgi:hypothetical protein
MRRRYTVTAMRARRGQLVLGAAAAALLLAIVAFGAPLGSPRAPQPAPAHSPAPGHPLRPRDLEPGRSYRHPAALARRPARVTTP